MTTANVTIEKNPNEYRGQGFGVFVDGVQVGYVRKLNDTRTDSFPWRAMWAWEHRIEDIAKLGL